MVIGAGAAGMAAALKAKEEGAEVLLVERDERTGGILNQCIHNGFGLHYFRQELTGPEYAERFQERMEKMGVKALVNAYVKQIGDREVILVTEKGIEKVEVGALVYATGARERPFGSLMIPGDRPSGIFTAGVAQRLINIENRLPGKGHSSSALETSVSSWQEDSPWREWKWWGWWSAYPTLGDFSET